MDMPEDVKQELDYINKRIARRAAEFHDRFGDVTPPGYYQEYISDLVAVKRGILEPYTEKPKVVKSKVPEGAWTPESKEAKAKRIAEVVKRALKQEKDGRI